MSELLLANEAARIVGVSPATIIRYEKAGKLNALKTGGGVRIFKREEVEAFRARREERKAETEVTTGVPE